MSWVFLCCVENAAARPVLFRIALLSDHDIARLEFFQALTKVDQRKDRFMLSSLAGSSDKLS
jgi:hypothetical protein